MIYLIQENQEIINTKYRIEDAVVSAFSVFFTQPPSFLEHQRSMKSSKGKDNGNCLFSIKEILCDNQIRNLLDPIPASTIFGVFREVYQWLKTQGVIRNFLYLDSEILIALDGTEYFSSKKNNCPYCNCRNHRNKKTKAIMFLKITVII